MLGKCGRFFFIYEYLKVLITRSLKLLIAGNSIRDDHNLLLYNKVLQIFIAWWAGVGAGAWGGSGAGFQWQEAAHPPPPPPATHPLLPSPSLVVKRRRSDNVEFKCGECGG